MFKLRFLVAFLLAAVVTSATGQEDTTQADRIDQFEARMVESKERLNLTDEQVERVKPIIRSSLEATLLVLEEHGVDLEQRAEGNTGKRLSFRELRSVGRDMKKIRAKELDELSEVLDDEQLAEYESIQEERRNELRAKIRERRGR